MSLGITMMRGSASGVVVGTLSIGFLVDSENGVLLAVVTIMLGLTLPVTTGFCQTLGASMGLGLGA
jgi:hypothetical protein